MKGTQVHLALDSARSPQVGAALSELSKARWTPLTDEPLEGRLAFRADFLGPEQLKAVLAGLSERLGLPVFGASIWDSDVLWLQLATPGEAVVELKWPARSRGGELAPFREQARSEVTDAQFAAVMRPQLRDDEDAELKLAELAWLFGWGGLRPLAPDEPAAKVKKQVVGEPPQLEAVGVKVSVKPVQVCRPGDVLQLQLNVRNTGGPGPREKLYLAVRATGLGSGAFELTQAGAEPLPLLEEREDVGQVFVLPKVPIRAAKTNPTNGWKTPADVPLPPLELHARAIANVEGEVRISTRVPDVSVRPQRLAFRIVEHY